MKNVDAGDAVQIEVAAEKHHAGQQSQGMKMMVVQRRREPPSGIVGSQMRLQAKASRPGRVRRSRPLDRALHVMTSAQK